MDLFDDLGMIFDVPGSTPGRPLRWYLGALAILIVLALAVAAIVRYV